MIRPELQLIALARLRGRRGRHPCVEQQHVEALLLGGEARGGRADGREGGKVQIQQVDLRRASRGADVGDERIGAAGAASGQVEVGGIVGGEGCGSRGAEAGIALWV